MINQQEQLSYIHSSWTSFNGTHFSLGLQGEPRLCTVMCVIFCFPWGLLAPETLRNFSFSSGTKAFLNTKPAGRHWFDKSSSRSPEVSCAQLACLWLCSGCMKCYCLGPSGQTHWGWFAYHALSIFHVNVQHLIHRINSTHTFVLVGYTRMRPCLTGVLL